jgi:hypothetical protein
MLKLLGFFNLFFPEAQSLFLPAALDHRPEQLTRAPAAWRPTDCRAFETYSRREVSYIQLTRAQLLVPVGAFRTAGRYESLARAQNARLGQSQRRLRAVFRRPSRGRDRAWRQTCATLKCEARPLQKLSKSTYAVFFRRPSDV